MQRSSQNDKKAGNVFLPLTFFSEDTKENKSSQQNNKKLKDWEKAEKLFEYFLNKEEIPFFRIDQKDTKSLVLKKKGIVRPDYIIQTKNDYFYIDVKQRSDTNYDKSNKKRFIIDQDIILGLYFFQEEFHQKVWLAYIDDLQKTNFYYVSISKVYEYYINILNTIVGENFFDHFREIYHCLFTNEIKDQLWIFIPEILFFNKLSFEKGFYKESDKDFYKEEVDFHKSIWDNFIDKKLYKEYIEILEKIYDDIYK